MTWRIPQAVVTDPGGASAGGYVLVAASPGLLPQEGRFFESSPGVSDYLHDLREDSARRPCFSFFPLPGGRQALVRRFVEGRERGSNRVVAHLLACPEELLAALQHDPWLLASACTFQPAGGGKAASLAGLGELAAVRDLHQLPDLEVTLPADPPGARRTALLERRGYLVEHWGAEGLERRLAAVLGALEEGRRLLLPQTLEHEQLLGLAVSCLPPADRRAVAWTTHFAPGVRVLFHLANAPDPEEARQLHARPEEWRVLSERGALPAPPPGAAALARALVRAPERFEPIARGLERYGLGMLAPGSERIRAWVEHELGDGLALEKGFARLEDLGAYLRRHPPAGAGAGSYPWLRDGDLVMAGVAATGLRILKEGEFEAVAAALHNELRTSGWAPVLLQGPRVRRTLELVSGRPGAGLFLLALLRHELAAVPSQEAPAQRPALEDLADLLRTVPGARKVAGLWGDLGFDLALAGSPRHREVLKIAVESQPAVLSRLQERLQPEAAYWPAARALLEQAQETGQGEAEAALMAAAVPIVSDLPAPHDAVAAADPRLLDGLQALIRRPEALAMALSNWDGSLLERALLAFKLWAGVPEHGAPAVVRVARLLLEAGELPPALAECPSLAGVTLVLLEAAGRSPVIWLPFALAEARVVDTVPEVSADRFTQTVEETAAAKVRLLDEARATEVGRRVLASLRAAADAGARLGAGHRALLAAVLPAVPRLAEETTGTLAAVFQAEGVDLLAWHGTLARVVDRLRRSEARAASTLAASWWTRLGLEAGAPRWRQFPAAALDTLEALQPEDAGKVLDVWLPQLSRLGDRPGEDALIAALRRLSTGRSEVAVSFEAARLERLWRRQEMNLIRALNRLEGYCARAAGAAGSALFVKEAERFLPSSPEERLPALLTLLVEDRVQPTVKRALGGGILRSALNQARLADLAWLPDLDQLDRGGPLLRLVAEHVGTHWSAQADLAKVLVAEALERGRSDVLTHLLSRACGGDGDFLDHLVASGERRLLHGLEQILETPAGLWRLASLGPALERARREASR